MVSRQLEYRSESKRREGFRPGFYSENVMGKQSTIQADANYFSDPDGVVRRGMSGWVGIASQGGTTLGLPDGRGDFAKPALYSPSSFQDSGGIGVCLFGNPVAKS